MSFARAGIRGASRLLQASASCRSSAAATASPRCSNASPRSILRQMEQPGSASQSSRTFCSRRSQELMLRRRGLMTQLPSAVARALAMRTNLILIDLLGIDDT